MSDVLFKVTIPGRAGILKSSKKIIKNPRTGHLLLRASDRYKIWAEHALAHIKQASQGMFSSINFPVNLSVRFYLKNHQNELDTSNGYQGIEDLLEKSGVVANDKLFYTHDGSGKFFGESEERIEVEITPLKLKEQAS